MQEYETALAMAKFVNIVLVMLWALIHVLGLGEALSLGQGQQV